MFHFLEVKLHEIFVPAHILFLLVLILCPLALNIFSSPLSDKFRYEHLDFYQFGSNHNLSFLD